MLKRIVLTITISLSSVCALVHGQVPSTAPDANLYTSYSFQPNAGYQSIYWSVCGSTLSNQGCYGFGTLGPFWQVGALIEGNAAMNLNTGTVTRLLYVVDQAIGGGTEVLLHVYKKIDVVTSSWDTVTVTATKTITLPLIGGPGAVTSMAANAKYIFIGTDQSPQAVCVQKGTLGVTQVGGFAPSANVTSITSDKYGYVTVTYGGFTSGVNGNWMFDPNGKQVGEGGGAWFMLGTTDGFSTAKLPPAPAASR